MNPRIKLWMVTAGGALGLMTACGEPPKERSACVREVRSEYAQSVQKAETALKEKGFLVRTNGKEVVMLADHDFQFELPVKERVAALESYNAVLGAYLSVCDKGPDSEVIRAKRETLKERLEGNQEMLRELDSTMDDSTAGATEDVLPADADTN